MVICHQLQQTQSLTRPNELVENTLHIPLGDGQEVRILVAEDHLLNQMLMKRIFEKMHIDCDFANDGQEAVEACHRNRYDLIFMDITMPLRDGYEATKMIRGINSERQPYIVALTANATNDDKQKCFEAGMNEFMPKPISLERINLIMEKMAKITMDKMSGD
ncbi:response regulator [Anoxynatronum buryatiense]|uniref:Stage 0 sporulation protein A homolog n=1 Tax=Anoxynatronum buryatiense TaxID=489973 RepID=A0AA45WT36_9CLOT|nr:response regulator [Anoxynatronum buryatiense]SMP40134.1 CheY chemotaxis protein or a CheY-like REC (receiver) domain [Anoxynatronum buryatiense]